MTETPETIVHAQTTAPTPSLKRSAGTVLTALGLTLLVVGIAFVWSQVRDVAGSVSQLDMTTHRLMAGTEKSAAAQIASLRGELAGRLAALEQRLMAVEQEQARPVPLLDRLTARVTALEVPAPATTIAREAAPSDLVQRVARIEQRLAAAEAAVTQTTIRAAQLDAFRAASLALAAGKPLGIIPGAPPALARYADSPPPTEAGLRREFDGLAARAAEASKPRTSADTMAQRMWLNIQSLVTIKDRDKVLIGAPAAIVLGEAQDRLAAGDLAAAVAALAALDPGSAVVMADWTARARALVDARAALATLPGAI